MKNRFAAPTLILVAATVLNMLGLWIIGIPLAAYGWNKLFKVI